MKPDPDPTFSCKSAADLIDQALDFRYFHAEDGHPPAISARWVKGNDPLVVIVGDNASGKSFFRRLVGQMCRLAEGGRVEFIGVSMQHRQTGGIERAFVYGDETWQATGTNSIGTVLTGIKTCRIRDTSHVIFWDEPDLGLSDNSAAGVGATIAKFAASPPKHTRAAFVVTHSKPLVSALVSLKPHTLILGDNSAESLEAWLAQPITPIDPEAVMEAGHNRFKAIQRILPRT